MLAPYQSMTTTGSVPTTQASCPLGSAVTSPGSAMNSVPSSMRIPSFPDTWYWKCGASQLRVPASGFTCSDQRQPGWNTRRPTAPSPMLRISALPRGNSRVSSGRDVGITKASLHYHFPTKADLGLSLVRRYQVTFDEALEALSRSGREARGLLQGYVELYGSVLRKDRMCLCGMLAAEHTTLPAPMQRALQAFFDANERWLTGVLEAGRRSGELKLPAGAREEARLLVAGLEGALLVARSFDDTARFKQAAARLLGGVLGGGHGGVTRAPRASSTARQSGARKRKVSASRASASQ